MAASELQAAWSTHQGLATTGKTHLAPLCFWTVVVVIDVIELDRCTACPLDGPVDSGGPEIVEINYKCN